MEEVIIAFHTLARQHTLLSYELGRVRDVRARRVQSVKSEYEENLENKIALLEEALRPLAKLIEQ